MGNAWWMSTLDIASNIEYTTLNMEKQEVFACAWKIGVWLLFGEGVDDFVF